MTLADEVAATTIRLQHLELKSEADENLIALLKQQNELQAAMLAETRYQRDVAVRNAVEVTGIITTLGSLALSGIRKMQGDATPVVIPDKPPLIVKHLQTADRRLPPVRPEQDELLPRPSFLDRPRDPERLLPLTMRQGR